MNTNNEVSLSLKNGLEVTHNSSSSVEIKRNSKGGIEFMVKIYNEDPTEALKEAASIYKSLEKKFPFNEG